MTNAEKYNLITRNLEEVLTEEELKALIESGTPLKHYIGFEISGKLHIGYYYVCLKIKDLQDAGAETTIWLADLHSAINDKLDGNLETIKRVAKVYFEEAFKCLFGIVGGDSSKLNFKLCSETYAKNPDFWQTMLEVGKTTTLARTKRSITIMGREGSDDSMETAKLFYPIMQAADIFLLGANIAHAGIDQRKVHVVAIEAANQVKTHPLLNANGQQIKPVAIHHPILLGLDFKGNIQQGEIDETAMRTKMSKSRSDSGVIIHDSPEEINRKINEAFCPEGQIENNPILNWVEHLILRLPGETLEVARPEKFGGNITYTSYADLEKDFEQKKLHPQDLKKAVAEWLVVKLELARKYFEDPKRKAALEEIEQLTQKK